uniref:hypothetical protein n=1 Tax=Catenulispora acidiphila TaxID=304895 RepID=UPI001CBFC6FC|nr:hypothetical protein [Catenulispora acidiphila]
MRPTSRLTVAGLRPNSRAMARSDLPARSKSAMAMRSSSDKNRDKTSSPSRCSVIGDR